MDHEWTEAHWNQSETHIYGSSRLGLELANVYSDDTLLYRFKLPDCEGLPYTNWSSQEYEDAPDVPQNHYVRGDKRYEITNHLGNVLATVTDRRFHGPAAVGAQVDHWVAETASAQMYWPFGSVVSEYQFTAAWAGDYRYGFNGKEFDPEWGNQYDYGFRIYNPQVGRFLSTDPLSVEYPWYTPYQFAGCSPIFFIDRDGLEREPSSLPWPQSYLRPATEVDMANAPNMYTTPSGRRVYTELNAAGQNRNHAWYWRQVYENNPAMFSDANVTNINRGSAPVVDAVWAQHNPQHKAFMGEVLEHHHYQHGNRAFALPRLLHRGRGYYNLWHTLHRNRLYNLAMAMTIAPEISGYLADRPNSLIMMMEGYSFNLRKNVVYEDWSDHYPGEYFVLRERTSRTLADGRTEYISVMDFYGNFTFDSNGKFVPDETTFIKQITYLEYLDADGDYETERDWRDSQELY